MTVGAYLGSQQSLAIENFIAPFGARFAYLELRLTFIG